MKYILMAGGHYPHLQSPRQLWKINDETILGRTIRFLHEAGIDKDHIVLSYHDPIFEEYALEYGNIPILKQTDEVTWDQYDKIFPVLPEECCYIFGDVFFSRAAIKTIVETQTDDVEFFASAAPFAKDYIKQWAEPFAFKVKNTEHFHNACKEARQLRDQKILQRGAAWELWQVIKHTDLNNIIVNYKVINDYTCDIDSNLDLEDIRYKVNHGEIV